MRLPCYFDYKNEACVFINESFVYSLMAVNQGKRTI